MQTVIQVVCKGGHSLRDAVVRDSKLKQFRLEVVHSKRQHRAHGWAKIISTDGARGALNIVWNASTRTLTSRVVTRYGNSPAMIIGDFIGYLLSKHNRRIVTVLVSQAK